MYEILDVELSKKFHCSYTLSADEKQTIRKLLYDMKDKWQKARRMKARFMEQNTDWLSRIVTFGNNTDISKEKKDLDAVRGPGRHSQSFEDSSERSKRRKTAAIREQSSAEELAFATHMSLRAAGKLDAAKVVKEVALGSPTKASKYTEALRTVTDMTTNRYSADAALSLIVEYRMSKHVYQGIRSGALELNSKIYPSYKSVLEAKKKCYPPKDDITITESKAAVKLQALLDHTASRILAVQSEVLHLLPSSEIYKLNLVCKWGCDGTSGQSTFKQKFDNDDEDKTDATIFFTSVVPLQLVFVDGGDNEGITVWKNPRPSSPRFCRPIKIEFLKETAEGTRNEVKNIKEQEEQLQPFHTIVNGKEVTVSYKLALTMVDGKVCNSLTSTASSQRCYLCGATSKEFNDIDNILKRKINEDHLQYGISSLHAWIRFFECLIHISYRLEIKKWQADKKSIESRKKTIQKGFRERLGLLIDQPKQGYGSTNDGNTARRFFQNSDVSASLTGIDEDLIKRFHVILQIISCGFEINVDEFEKYAVETARRYVLLYPWYYMPTTVHKLLIHGPKIIGVSMLPIGQMSEEAQESCNKYIKSFRLDFARKFSRKQNMEDVFARLLIASDPVISSLRKLPAKSSKSLSREAMALLESPTANKRRVVAKSDCSDSSDNNDSDSDSNWSL